MTLAFLAFAAAGHAILWAAIVNRLHGTAIQQSLRKFTTSLCMLAAITLPLVVAAVVYRDSWWMIGVGSLLRFERDANWIRIQSQKTPDLFSAATQAYVFVCAIVCIFAIIRWCRLRLHAERGGALVANR